MSSEQDALANARAWPFEEARKILERIGGKTPEKGYVLFETGYGPSGLPHIGTFGEVVRTSMVRRAFQALAPQIPTRLFAYSDDMDGFRKVPDNVPEKEMLKQNLHKPLTRVPDPFGTHESFGHHNNARLRGFLDGFGFEYEFQSATDWYTSGRLDAVLLTALERYDAIMALMLPTLGEERQESYSPFLPISPKTGRVLQTPILERKVSSGTVVFKDEDGTLTELPVTGGHCKLQWKPDWAARWVALGVDYEMCGKDLIPTFQLSSRIAQILGGEPPVNLIYELFLDDKGGKISKSKGNGLSVEEWLTYAPPESLAYYMQHKPRAAKKLFFDVIPRAVDDYLDAVANYAGQDPQLRLENPAWHIHAGRIPNGAGSPVSFGMLMNLASVINAEDKSVLWAYLARYLPGMSPETAPYLDDLAGFAVRYYQDFVKPTKAFRDPTEGERVALTTLRNMLAARPDDTTAEVLQDDVYAAGKEHMPKEQLRSWFGTLYEVLLGQTQGPRFGSFIKLYGIQNAVKLIDDALARQAAA